MQLCERLLLEYPEKFTEKPAPLYRALLLSTISSSNLTRTKCFAILNKIVNSLSGNTLVQYLLKDLAEYLETTTKIQVSKIYFMLKNLVTFLSRTKTIKKRKMRAL